MNETAERILARTDRSSECWLFVGSTDKGYGQINQGGYHMSAHRAVYLGVFGEVPPGWDVGHVCHDQDPDCPGGFTCLHRRCVRPDHLMAQTPKENRGQAHLRITRCPKGHPYSEENTYIRPNGGRKCRACNTERERERRAMSTR